jgi:hypothetical protein
MIHQRLYPSRQTCSMFNSQPNEEQTHRRIILLKELLQKFYRSTMPIRWTITSTTNVWQWRRNESSILLPKPAINCYCSLLFLVFFSFCLSLHMCGDTHSSVRGQLLQSFVRSLDLSSLSLCYLSIYLSIYISLYIYVNVYDQRLE